MADVTQFKVCPACGKRHLENQCFCPWCGHSYQPPHSYPSAQPPQQYQQPIPPPYFQQAAAPDGQVYGGVSIILGAVSFCLCRLILGTGGIAFGIAAIAKRSSTLGFIGIIVSALGMIFGVLFALALSSSGGPRFR